MTYKFGDKVTYKAFGRKEIVLIGNDGEINNIQKDIQENKLAILKIERPKYEVVEEKKELLTEEEKEFLRQTLKFGNYGNNTENGIIKYIIKDGYYIELHYEDWACNTIYIDKNLYFRNLEKDKKYTLKELGLEEN